MQDPIQTTDKSGFAAIFGTGFGLVAIGAAAVIGALLGAVMMMH
ncbi:MAG: hypothetical protein WCL10_04780 [Novosphingobium sp.]|jgi:hypothetical protein